MSLDCNSADNILVFEQFNGSIYDVCGMKRHFGLSTFNVQYRGSNFILSLWMRSTTFVSVTVSFIINGLLPTMTDAPPVTSTTSPSSNPSLRVKKLDIG
jgi:hypothetical protein